VVQVVLGEPGSSPGSTQGSGQGEEQRQQQQQQQQVVRVAQRGAAGLLEALQQLGCL
jgi:hypothetical protein